MNRKVYTDTEERAVNCSEKRSYMEITTFDCIVVGTGAAGYNAACRLKELGKNVAIVTEGITAGTSRNTGSDKQTYYKLGLAGDSPDSVGKMAKDLFDGGCTDGDNALCEAALSVRCFLHLYELGVPFPVNRYGEFVGYKTDHDPYERATSAGPLTSKYMTEALEQKAQQLQIPVLDGLLAVEILKHEGRVCGLMCIHKESGTFRSFSCGNIILCTGGPAGIYGDCVYPVGHTGSTGLALRAGAAAQNLTLWQFGLASVQPRWNVSGSYMQVLPRFVSVDEAGKEYEFLNDYFPDGVTALNKVFLKGYQWPFDSRRVMKGSSVIDLLVYRETVLLGRKVYLDFTKNPFRMAQIPYGELSEEACTYLEKAGVCFGTPIQRLQKMNAPAVELYRSKGVDLEKEYLPIALCAQHCNGGIGVDAWWQTRVPGLFVAGEAAGTHGIARPGGSALNAGQVGALRAATYIGRLGNASLPEDVFQEVASVAAQRYTTEAAVVLGNVNNVDERIASLRRKMSNTAGAIRDPEGMETLLSGITAIYADLTGTVGVGGKKQLYRFYQLRDMLLTQQAVLTAMLDQARQGTCGSCLYHDAAGEKPELLEELFRFRPASRSIGERIQETVPSEEGFVCLWRNVRPIPEKDSFFETVWRSYRENGNVY